jgi:hypothetical protein
MLCKLLEAAYLLRPSPIWGDILLRRSSIHGLRVQKPPVDPRATSRGSLCSTPSPVGGTTTTCRGQLVARNLA